MAEEGNRRSSNFSQEEVDLLISIIKTYRNIIECKKTDRVLWKEKDATWEQIATQFNMRSGQYYRTAAVLRNKYENLKKRTKKKYADNKCEVFSTGEGPPTNIIFTSVDEEIKELLGVRLDGLPCAVDSDADREDISHGDGAETIIIQPGVASQEDGDDAQSVEDASQWQYYAMAKVSQPISSSLEPRDVSQASSSRKRLASRNEEVMENTPKKQKVTGSTTNEKWSKLADNKNKFLLQQQENLNNEHLLKKELLHLQIEEQQLKNSILKLELEMKEREYRKTV